MTTIPRLQSISRLAVMAALAIAPAFAVNVTYSTTGSFNSTAPCTGGTSLTGCGGAGSVSITYGALTNNTVSTLGGITNASFGSFTASTGTGYTIPTGESFTLSISQSVPTVAGPQTLSDVFQGQITGNSSNVELQFTGGNPAVTLTTFQGAAVYQFNLAGVLYDVDEFTSIVPNSTNQGVVTIQGAINASAVPEPAFYGLTGVGFAGLLAMAIRRRRQIAA